MSEITVTYTKAGARKTIVVDGAKHDIADVLERCRRNIFPGVEPPERDEAFERAMAIQAQAKTDTAGTAEQDHAMAKEGVKDTSRDAYAKHAASGKLGRQHEIILAVIRGQTRDITRQELAKKTGLGINAVCGRVNELMAEPFRLVEVRRRRKCGVTGETVEALRAKEKA